MTPIGTPSESSVASGRVSLKHSGSWLFESKSKVTYFLKASPVSTVKLQSLRVAGPESRGLDTVQQTASPPQKSPVVMQSLAVFSMSNAHLHSFLLGRMG